MKKPLAIALALGAGALFSVPASAAATANAGQIRAEINQLDRQVDRMRGLSNREEARLERRIDSLQSLYRSYARGGFTNRELRSLNYELGKVKAEIRDQSHDRNRHRR